MDTLVEGVDYQLEDVDYDKEYEDLINRTYAHSQRFGKYKCFWDYLDVCFDAAARNPINLGVEMEYKAAECFCLTEGIHDIPPLYKEMFDVGRGFLCQAKLPMYMADHWCVQHPYPLTIYDVNSEIMQRFINFLERNQDKHVCKCTLDLIGR